MAAVTPGEPLPAAEVCLRKESGPEEKSIGGMKDVFTVQEEWTELGITVRVSLTGSYGQEQIMSFLRSPLLVSNVSTTKIKMFATERVLSNLELPTTST